jgi:hypothetical protein
LQMRLRILWENQRECIERCIVLFAKKSNFLVYLQRREYYEAYLEYDTNEQVYEDELRELKDNRNKEDFRNYLETWRQFKEFVLNAENDKAKDLILNAPFKNDMGKQEIKTILSELAEKTADSNCFQMFWDLFGEDTVASHDEALSLLNGGLAHCPESKEKAREHLWWIVNNAADKQRLKYAELGLDYYLKSNAFVTADDAANFIEIARSISPKSKGALRTEITLYQRDVAFITKIRPLLENGQYDEAFEIPGGIGNPQTRRVLLRAAHENKPDTIHFVEALRQLYGRTKNPSDAYAAAIAIWQSDVRKNPQELAWSMETSLAVLDDLPRKTNAMTTILDALYLLDPYPLPDEKARELAELVLQENPEDEIALESLAIVREQAQKSQNERV